MISPLDLVKNLGPLAPMAGAMLQRFGVKETALTTPEALETALHSLHDATRRPAAENLLVHATMDGKPVLVFVSAAPATKAVAK